MRTSLHLLAGLLFTPAALAQAHAAGEPPGIEELKSAYLACSAAAEQSRLDTANVMRCSVIYEELKRRAFDGDFDRLLAWSRTQTPAPVRRP